jgi:SAM-dependent methyltransferase
VTTDLRQNYYRALPDRGGKNLYELWEDRIPFGDSITPSGFAPDYVARIIQLASESSEEGARVVSLGSGNGFVEALLHEIGYEVLCVDHNQDAVEITTKKGLESLCMDFYDLPASLFVNTSLIYADGFFGHLYEDGGGGLHRAVDHLASMPLDSNTRLLVSNDAPLKQDLESEPHASVPDFWYMSPEFLGAQFDRVGFETINLETFTYHRPVSGARNRAIYQGTACSG